MAKKGSGVKYVSKGERKADRSISKAVRRDRDSFDIMAAKHRAYAKGHNVVLTVENPNPNETNKKFIRVNARDVYGDFRNFGKAPAIKTLSVGE
jgi:chorismate synthase